MAGFDVGGSFAAGGASEALQQLFAQRLAQQRLAMAQQQQAAENDYRNRSLDQQDRLRQDALTETTRNHSLEDADRKAAQQTRERDYALKLGDTIPADTFLSPDSPSVQPLQSLGMLKTQQERPAVLEGPLLPGDTGAAKPQGFLKTSSANQQNTLADNARADATAKQQRDYQDAELRIQQQNANTAANKPNTADSGRLDKSYQFNATQLENLRKPIDAKVSDFATATEALNQRTPAADALVAPKVLSVIAGGQGSGVRINNAEIERVLGGRSNFEGIKAALNKWNMDPSKALSITDTQRQQIGTLLDAVGQKARQKSQALIKAHQSLVDATDVNQHRQIVADVQKELDAIDSGGGASPAAPAAPAPAGRGFRVVGVRPVGQ